MAKKIAVVALILFAACAVGHAQVSGSTTVTITSGPPPGALLTGVTVPSSSNTPSSTAYTSQGWTLVCAEGYEGTIGSNCPNEFNFGTATTTNPHTGTKSQACNINFDGEACGLNIPTGTIGTSSHVYISYYRYMDSNACMDTEIYFGEFGDPNGGQFNAVMDTQNTGGTGSNPVCLTSGTYTQLIRQSDGGLDFPATGGWNPPRGTWEQVEFELQANTCNGSTSNNDGLYALYINGVQNAHQAGIDITGCGSDRSAVGMFVTEGGFYTFCASNPSCAPANGAFNVYMDDLIILKK